MTFDILVLDTDFTVDPGIETFPGTLAVGNREWNPLGRWDANFGGDTTLPSWAYFDARGPRTGFNDDNYKWRMIVHQIITGGSGTNSQGYIGLHSDPNDVSLPHPDSRNFLGYLLEWNGTQFSIRAHAWDKNGVSNQGTIISNTETDIDVEINYSPTTRTLSIQVRKHSNQAILGNSSVVLPGGQEYLELKYIASRDSPLTGTGSSTNITGYIDDLTMEWLEVDEDWVICVENQGCVILNSTAVYNKNQPPRESVVSAQGRQWDNTYHDGGGPITISLEGTLLRESCDDFLDIEEVMLPAYAEGSVVELYSRLRGYTLKRGKIALWDMPRETQRLDNQDFALIVKNRRKPDIT